MLTTNHLSIQAPWGPSSQKGLDLADQLSYAVRHGIPRLARGRSYTYELLSSRFSQLRNFSKELVGRDNVLQMQDRHNQAFLDAIAVIGGGLDALALRVTSNPAVLVAKFKASCAKCNVTSNDIPAGHLRIFELLQLRSNGQLLLNPDMHPKSAYFIGSIIPNLMAAAVCGGTPGLLRACDLLMLCSMETSPLERTASETGASVYNALRSHGTKTTFTADSVEDPTLAEQALAEANFVEQLVEIRRRGSLSLFSDESSIRAMSISPVPRLPQAHSPMTEPRSSLLPLPQVIENPHLPLTEMLSLAQIAPCSLGRQPSATSLGRRLASQQRDDFATEPESAAPASSSKASYYLVDTFPWTRNGVEIQSGIELFTALSSSHTRDGVDQLYSARVEGLNIEKASLSFFAASTAKKDQVNAAAPGASWAISVNGWDLECNDGHLPHLFAKGKQAESQDRLTLRLQRLDVSVPATTLRQMIATDPQALQSQFEGDINGKAVEVDLSTLVGLIGPGSAANLSSDTQVALRIQGQSVRAPAAWMRRLLDVKGQN